MKITVSLTKDSSSSATNCGISVRDLKLAFIVFSSNDVKMLGSGKRFKKSRCSTAADEIKDCKTKNCFLLQLTSFAKEHRHQWQYKYLISESVT